MKIAGVFVLLALALPCCFSGIASQNRNQLDCTRYNQEPFVFDGELLCPEVVLFVCGTDGVTYWHECEICRLISKGVDVNKEHEGTCGMSTLEPLSRTEVIDPET